MGYSEKLKQFCDESGFKKIFIASKIGISSPYLWRLCHRKNLFPSLSICFMIEEVTGGIITKREIEKEKEDFLNERFEDQKEKYKQEKC